MFKKHLLRNLLNGILWGTLKKNACLEIENRLLTVSLSLSDKLRINQHVKRRSVLTIIASFVNTFLEKTVPPNDLHKLN